MMIYHGDLTDANIKAAIEKHGTKRAEVFVSEKEQKVIYLTGDTLVYLKGFDELEEKYNV